MKGLLEKSAGRLVWKFDDEILWIEAYETNGIRVRSTREARMPELEWALLSVPETDAVIEIGEGAATVQNGEICAVLSATGKLEFRNAAGKLLLKEQWQDRQDDESRMSLMLSGRLLKPVPGGIYEAQVTFESNGEEKIFGMGQYQMPFQNLQGCDLELAQRNSQVSIPFYQSDRGYGFLWNCPAVGRAVFAKNHIRFTARRTSLIDYWITVGDTPAQINEQFTQAVGRAGSFPTWALGLWQSKLRYKTQEELLSAAREYHRRGIPLSVIVCDFFHWPTQGDWHFDPRYWPDPQAMVDELKTMGIELMVSVWTTVDPRSDHYAEMKRRGYLVRTDLGVRTQMNCLGADVFFDATNPNARKYVFDQIRENYMKYGIKLFWLDVAEPEYTEYDYENYRYYSGTCLETGNIYPKCYAEGFFDGLKKEGIEAPITLVRSAWLGSQKYGTVLWSGDIHSTFEVLRMQFAAGMNVSMSGIPWWTTDIGGFYGGDPNSAYFRELIVRWFQFGVFCPIFRLHGWRLPTGEGTEKPDTGLFDFDTCGENEIWSFGEEVYGILRNLVLLREAMKPYLEAWFQEASKTGTPIMRPLFYDFPKDASAWTVEHQFMFGPDLLAAPVLYQGVFAREVYLPEGTDWVDAATGFQYAGGQTVKADAPLDTIPLFVKKGSRLMEVMNKK